MSLSLLVDDGDWTTAPASCVTPLENLTVVSSRTTRQWEFDAIAGDDGVGEPKLSTVEAITFSVVMSGLIVATIVGNILVVLSVFTYGPLKTVPNFFVASLACADLAVAILVMPFSVANFVVGRWSFGHVWCLAWLTFDILTCTASILHLCAIALDRYHAIHDPITYAIQRTRRRVVIKIIVVWTLSAVISVPPLIGWNGLSLYDPVSEQCKLTDDRGFVVYSAAGSFYIPLAIMTVVYARIFRATRARLRARAKATAAARLRAAKSTTATATTTTPVFTPAAASPAVGGGVAASAQCPDGGEKKSGIGNGSAPTGNDAAREPEVVGATPNEFQQHQSTSENVVVANCGKQLQLLSPVSTSHPLHQHQQPHQLTVPQVEYDDVTGNSSPTMSPRFAAPAAGNRKKNGGGPSGGSAARYSVPKGAPVNRQLYEFMEEKQRISLSKERRAARTMAIIMGAFVACWMPFFLMYVVFPFCNWCAAAFDFRVINCIVWLGYVNSALNPVIYTVFNVDFRRAFQNLLTGKCHLASS